MIAYKATYNFKCRNQTYEVGKTYTASKMKMCQCGIHFCKKMEDTLDYYEYDPKTYILLEVEIIGDVEHGIDKSVTNKLKVLRVIPKEEYNEVFLKRISIYESDDGGNMISKTYSNGSKYLYEYDDRGNMISETYSNGNKYLYEYDDRGNKISMTYPNGNKILYEYAIITSD